LDATAYLGSNGRTALSVEAEYELLFTQKLILQPRAELSLHGKNDPDNEVGHLSPDLNSGFKDHSAEAHFIY